LSIELKFPAIKRIYSTQVDMESKGDGIGYWGEKIKGMGGSIRVELNSVKAVDLRSNWLFLYKRRHD
jgi:hypothetical protein